jgi:hypothetical protein
MEKILNFTNSYEKVKTTLIDLIALTFIFFVPALSHLFSFPLYLLEPMRIMLVLSLVHTTKRNAFLIALVLPIFSLIISSHPSLVKSLLIVMELGLNVWLFSFFTKRNFNLFISMFVSIIASKLVYYGMKYITISFSILNSELISTPIFLQFGMTIVFSLYAYMLLKNKS